MESPERQRSTACFLAERFLARCTPEALATIIEGDRAAAEAMAIGFLEAIYVPDDEVFFALLEAQNAELIAQMSERFGLAYYRVLPATSIRWASRGAS